MIAHLLTLARQHRRRRHNMTQLATLQRISDLVDEYNAKLAAQPESLQAYKKACETLEAQLTISGQFGESFGFTSIYEHKATASLLKSAWRKVYAGLNIDKIASASDRDKFSRSIEHGLPEFTLDNIRATFGDYIMNPRQNILRGLAEVFCNLDPYYKSHNKIKFGSERMPKRVVFSNISSTYGWGFDKLQDTLKALFTYQNRRQPDYLEMQELMKNPTFLKSSHGIELRRFKNGNAHLFFDAATCKDINLALAEYYGEVLPDAPQAADKPQASTAVSKDLQYYPTPERVVERIVNEYSWKGCKVLEPSAGCGRIMDGLRKAGAQVVGVEFDASRAELCRSKGHAVMIANFLQVTPTADFDKIVMNPPFYGTHYIKHIEHAMKFLKPDGQLIAILPSTARYDHEHEVLKGGRWQDLPVGSFSESGTNINISVVTMWQREAVRQAA